MHLLILSLKNMLKSSTRSIMTFAILIVGVVFYIIMNLLLTSMLNLSINDMINEDVANIRMRIKNFDDDFPTSETNMWYYSDDKLKNITNITYTPRLFLSAEIDNYQDTLPIMLIGIDPEKDSEVFYTPRTTTNSIGDTAWVGKALANDLGVQEGEFVNLTFRTVDGTYISGEYEVGGLIDSSNPMYTDRSVIVNLQNLQQLLNTNLITYYNVKLKNISDQKYIISQLKQLYPNLEILSSEDVLKDYYDLIEQRRNFINVYVLLLGIITFLGLSNSILISVWEKRKITGTLRALGSSDQEILLLFVLEGAWIGIFGALFGVIAAVLINIPLAIKGIDYSQLIEQSQKQGIDTGFPIPEVLRTEWDLWYFLLPLLIVPIISIIVSLIPSRKSIKISIVECIRNND